MSTTFFDMLKKDWEITEGIVDGGYVYSTDRDVTGLPIAPVAGVKCRAGNPTQNQIAVAAATFGYQSTDQIWTVWSNTLRVNPASEATARIVPEEGDRLVVGGVTWLIKSVKATCYDTQFLMHCQRSTGTVR